MEKNAIVGKVYLRDWEVVVNDSTTDYNGLMYVGSSFNKLN